MAILDRLRPSRITISVAFLIGLLITFSIRWLTESNHGAQTNLPPLPASEIASTYSLDSGRPSRPPEEDLDETASASALASTADTPMPLPHSSDLDPSRVPRNTPLSPDVIDKLRLPDEFRNVLLSTDVPPPLIDRRDFLEKLQSANPTPWDEEATEMLNVFLGERLDRLSPEVTTGFEVRTVCLGEMCQIQVQGPTFSSLEGMSPGLVAEIRTLPTQFAPWLASQPWFGDKRFIRFVPGINHLSALAAGRPYVLLLLERGAASSYDLPR